MTVLLDNEPLSAEGLSPDASVAEWLEVAKARLEGTGALIVGLRHEDEDVPAERLEEMLSEPASRFEGLELVSGRPKEVVLEAMEQMRRAFGETFAAVQEAADALAAGRVADAMRTVGDCVKIWAQTQEAIVQGGRLMGLRLDDMEILDRPIAGWLDDLAGKLRELKDALASRDNVLLGDILRYEMDETLRQWERMLDVFIQRVEEIDDAVPADTH